MTRSFDGVTEDIYTRDRNVCRGDKLHLHMCKACLSPDKDGLHTHWACLPMWQTFWQVRGGGLTIDKGRWHTVRRFPTRGRGSEMERFCKFFLKNVLQCKQWDVPLQRQPMQGPIPHRPHCRNKRMEIPVTRSTRRNGCPHCPC